MLEAKWHIVLLNGLQARLDKQVVERFRTQKTGELLAFLALNSHRCVPREEIAGKVWPESSMEAGRASLRTALASLRQQLEPPGITANGVLQADRVTVRLRPDAISTDVSEFEAACQQADKADDLQQRLRADLQAVHLYRGDLMPGYYTDWILEERARLAQSYRRHLHRLVLTLRNSKQSELLLRYGHLLLTVEPFDEEIRLLLMRLYAESGQRDEALRCYEEWKRLLQDDLHTSLPQEAHLLAEHIQQMPVRHAASSSVDRTVSLQIGHSSQQADACRDIDTSRAEWPLSPVTAPAPSSARLPLSLTRFFGRETEIMQAARLLVPTLNQWRSNDDVSAQRLVTLTGPGGTGKTRLAIEVGRRLHEQAGLRVTFVSLADITDPIHIPEAIAGALLLASASGKTLLDDITVELSKFPHVLILDNCEQLLTAPEEKPKKRLEEIKAEAPYTRSKLSPDNNNACSGIAAMIFMLLERAPNIQCLVTSRQCLGVEGEQEFSIPPLPTPIHTGTPERLLEFASVKLFVNRAQLSRPDFQLTPRNADVIGSICAQLEGLPLALELAAAWVSTLSPTQIQERLSQRFDLLIGRKTGGISRHRSLRAALEWSYQLLSPEMQQFFTHLSVFRGGWTQEAAQHVCEEPDAAEFLRALRERSLIIVAENQEDGVENETFRFRMLETLREFASEQLTPEEQTRLQRRHLNWCLHLAANANPHLYTASQAIWLHSLKAEQDNLRAALQWSLEDDQSILDGMQLIVDLYQFWCMQGQYTETRVMIECLLAHPQAQLPTVLRTRGLNMAANMAQYQADSDTAIRHGKEALGIAERIGDKHRIAQALGNMGSMLTNQGELAQARHYFEATLSCYIEINDTRGIGAAYGGLSCVAEEHGDTEEAIYFCVKALEAQRQQQNLSGTTHFLKDLGCLHMKIGDKEKAYTCFLESLEGYSELGDMRGLAHLVRDILTPLPISLISVRLLGAAQALNVTTQAAPLPLTKILEHARGLLGTEAVEAAWAVGREITVAQMAQEIRSLLRQEFVPSPADL